MSSNQLKTQIIAVYSDDEECIQRDVLNESLDDQFFESSSDEDLNDNRYDTISDDSTLPEESLKNIESLYLKNNFNKFELIQKKSDKIEANPQMVCHLVLTDNKPNDDVMDNDLIDQNSKYIFRSVLQISRESEVKSKQKIERQRKLRSDLQINSIPKTFEEFLKIIFDLNADLIENQKSELFFIEEMHNKDIPFQSHDSYVKYFIPFVIREFWSALKTSRKRDIISYNMSFRKSDFRNAIYCSHIRNKSCNKSEFKFGQIVVIKYPEKSAQSQSYFGVVIDVITELIDKTSPHLSHSLFQSLLQSKEKYFIYESVVLICNSLAQNFESVSLIPLGSVQKYLLEARIVYELKDRKYEKICKQILNPNFKYGISGHSLNLEERKDLFDIQKDAIQKAYDICCSPEMEGFSSFLTVYGAPKTGKSEIIKETALQLLKSAEQKIKKLIIITTGITQLVDIIDNLKKNDIKVFHIDCIGDCLSHNYSNFRRIIKKLNKKNRLEDIIGKPYSLDQCLRLYGQHIQSKDLSIRDQYIKEIIDKRVVEHLLSESQVIIGSIDSVMNDQTFNRIVNMSAVYNITSALIDRAHLLTETELLTLLLCGVRKFVLFGDNHENPISFQKCDSFLRRYIGLYLKSITNVSTNDSILFLSKTIQRNNININNRQNNQNDNKSQLYSESESETFIEVYFDNEIYILDINQPLDIIWTQPIPNTQY